MNRMVKRTSNFPWLIVLIMQVDCVSANLETAMDTFKPSMMIYSQWKQIDATKLSKFLQNHNTNMVQMITSLAEPTCDILLAC